MSVKNLVKTIAWHLNIDNISLSSKQMSTVNILKKLKDKKVYILKEMKKETDKVTLNKFQEELEILSLLIKKGEKTIKYS